MTKTITITVPSITNPLKKIASARKNVKRSFLEAKMLRAYNRGDLVTAWTTYYLIKNV